MLTKQYLFTENWLVSTSPSIHPKERAQVQTHEICLCVDLSTNRTTYKIIGFMALISIPVVLILYVYLVNELFLNINYKENVGWAVPRNPKVFALNSSGMNYLMTNYFLETCK